MVKGSDNGRSSFVLTGTPDEIAEAMHSVSKNGAHAAAVEPAHDGTEVVHKVQVSRKERTRLKKKGRKELQAELDELKAAQATDRRMTELALQARDAQTSLDIINSQRRGHVDHTDLLRNRDGSRTRPLYQGYNDINHLFHMNSNSQKKENVVVRAFKAARSFVFPQSFPKGK